MTAAEQLGPSATGPEPVPVEGKVFEGRITLAMAARAVLITCLTALAYFACARLGYALAVKPANIVALWPPSGLMLAVLLISRKRDWPVLLLGAFAGSLASDMFSGYPLWFDLAAALVNCVEVAAAAWLLTRFIGTPFTLSTLREVIGLVAGAAVLSNGVTALLGGTLIHQAYGMNFWNAWFVWWVGDGMGMLIIAPVVLTWTAMLREWRAVRLRRLVEGLAFAIVLAGCAQIILGPKLHLALDTHLYMTFPILFAAALRYGPPGAATASLVVAGVTLWNLSQGQGPFHEAGQTTFSTAMDIYSYLALASLSSLIPSAILSERRTAVRRLAQNEERYRLLFAGNPHPMWAYDRNTLRFLEVNDAAVAKYGYSPEEFLSMRITEIRPPSEIPRLLELIHSQPAPRRRSGNWHHLLKDGRMIEVELDSQRIQLKGHDAALVVAQDVSEIRRAEHGLRESESRFRALVEHAAYGIFRCTVDGRLLDVNPALVALLGCNSKEEALELKLADIYVQPDVRSSLVSELLATGRLRNAEIEWRRKDGKRIQVRASARTVPSSDGGPPEIETFVEDITERQMMGKQIAALQKFEAIGQLAGGIAHDFNNVIGAIMGWADLALRDSVSGKSPEKKLEKIRDQVQRAASLTRQLLAFARRQILEQQAVDLNGVVNDALSLLEKVIGSHIEVRMLLAKPLGSVRADPSQMEQIMINLVVNARDAMPHGGRLLVETEDVVVDEDFCRTHVWARPGAFVRLSVSDTGLGMDAETLEHIFEPFFTTKGVGKGTGLGLATVYGIVRQHGGFVHVYSEPGHGATFRVYLPLGSGKPQALKPAESLPIAGGAETILVAEDHEGLREIARTVLEEYGYTVLAVANGEEAVTCFQQHSGSVALALMDVVMPKLPGPDAVRKMLAVRADLPVLYTTGYSAEMELLASVGSAAAVLQKPYSSKALAMKVREVLDRSA